MYAELMSSDQVVFSVDVPGEVAMGCRLLEGGVSRFEPSLRTSSE
jgi:hypothetical protein